MRHGRKLNHLGRQASHRKAMMANMACSLIEHKRIQTTLAKAKALKLYIEPLLTKSKTDSTHSRRTIFAYLKSKEAVSELFREVAPKVADRPGGYTRIIKTGARFGDAAEMCFIELVDFNELMLRESAAKKTTRRSRRGGAKKATDAVQPAKASPVAESTVVDAVVDTPVVDEVLETPAVEATVVEESPVEVVAEVAKTEESVADAPTEETSKEEESKSEDGEVEEPKA